MMDAELLQRFQAQPTPSKKAEAVCFKNNIHQFISSSFI
jgi:hypothetical protein